MELFSDLLSRIQSALVAHLNLPISQTTSLHPQINPEGPEIAFALHPFSQQPLDALPAAMLDLAGVRGFQITSAELVNGYLNLEMPKAFWAAVGLQMCATGPLKGDSGSGKSSEASPEIPVTFARAFGPGLKLQSRIKVIGNMPEMMEYETLSEAVEAGKGVLPDATKSLILALLDFELVLKSESGENDVVEGEKEEEKAAVLWLKVRAIWDRLAHVWVSVCLIVPEDRLHSELHRRLLVYILARSKAQTAVKMAKE